ncbi:MAG: hypothetical protein ACI8ZN_001023 [Bacteroidia bacterium]|jgi:hypothetical protein
MEYQDYYAATDCVRVATDCVRVATDCVRRKLILKQVEDDLCLILNLILHLKLSLNLYLNSLVLEVGGG